MHIIVSMMTDDDENQVKGTITLREGKLIAEGEEEELPGLTYMIGKPWWAMVDGTERKVDPATEPEVFLRHAHKIFHSPYLRASTLKE